MNTSKIKEIYRSIMQETEEMKVQREKVEKCIDDILEEQKQAENRREYEMFRDRFYQVAMIAEEGGFILGFRYATQLMAQCCMEKITVKPE